MKIKNKEDKNHAEKLLDKALASEDSGDSMRFSQAALNAANALCALTNLANSKLCDTWQCELSNSELSGIRGESNSLR